MNVYFEQQNRSEGEGKRPLRRISVYETFVWKGFECQIAGAYVCGQGIVLDVCRQVEPENIWTFLDKWEPLELKRKLTAQEESMWEYESPLETDIRMHAWINGKQIKSMQMYNASYIPSRDGGGDKNRWGREPSAQTIRKRSLWSFISLTEILAGVFKESAYGGIISVFRKKWC